jgi:hypothetical protein
MLHTIQEPPEGASGSTIYLLLALKRTISGAWGRSSHVRALDKTKSLGGQVGRCKSSINNLKSQI